MVNLVFVAATCGDFYDHIEDHALHATPDYLLAGQALGQKSGVSDGARTRDISDHNRVLYQLSYAHHEGVILRHDEGRGEFPMR